MKAPAARFLTEFSFDQRRHRFDLPALCVSAALSASLGSRHHHDRDAIQHPGKHQPGRYRGAVNWHNMSVSCPNPQRSAWNKKKTPKSKALLLRGGGQMVNCDSVLDGVRRPNPTGKSPISGHKRQAMNSPSKPGRMSTPRKAVGWIGVALMLFIILFPPHSNPAIIDFTASRHTSFILSTPFAYGVPAGHKLAGEWSINWNRWTIELTTTAISCSGLFMLLGVGRKQSATV